MGFFHVIYRKFTLGNFTLKTMNTAGRIRVIFFIKIKRLYLSALCNGIAQSSALPPLLESPAGARHYFLRVLPWQAISYKGTSVGVLPSRAVYIHRHTQRG